MVVVPVSDIIHPQKVVRIEGEGMVVDGWDVVRGNLYVKFDIIFPEFISLENKKVIERALDPENNK